MTTEKHREILIERKNAMMGTRPNREAIAVERLADVIDDVQLTNERELTLSTINMHWSTLRAIDEALQRIDEGTFGVCEECEGPIQQKRLLAVPWAAMCLDCQEAKDAAMDRSGRLQTAAA